MTRIAISTLIVRPGLSGSNESYLVNLVAALQHVDRDNDYLLFVTPQNAQLFTVFNARFRLIHVPRWAHSRLGRIALDQLLIPYWAKRLRAEILHYPGSVGSALKLGRPKQVVTVHYDIDPLHAPSVGWIKKAYFAMAMRWIRKAASAIIVPSHTLGQSLLTRWGLPASKLRVVHHGVDTANGARRHRADDRHVLDRIGVTPGYLLSVTNALPHKNVPCLLEAYALLSEEFERAAPLLIVGDMSSSTLREWARGLASRGIRVPSDRIVVTGRLPSVDLQVLYEHAGLMVTPTLTESFSLPLLEAMVHGCPVVASDIPAHREIGGDAVILVDPGSPRQFADACAMVLGDPTSRAMLVKHGRERARGMSWDRTARETVAVYASVG